MDPPSITPSWPEVLTAPHAWPPRPPQAPSATATLVESYTLQHSIPQSPHRTHSTTPPVTLSSLLTLPCGHTSHPPRDATPKLSLEGALTSLHLQLHGAIGPLLRVVVLDLHHEAAVEAAVQWGHVEHGDGEVAVVVGDGLQPVLPGQVLAGVGGLVATVVQVEILEREVADGPALGAGLYLAPGAAVPCLVEGQVVPFGHGAQAQDSAGEGDILALGTHVQGVRRGDLEGCHQTWQKEEKLSPV